MLVVGEGLTPIGGTQARFIRLGDVIAYEVAKRTEA